MLPAAAVAVLALAQPNPCWEVDGYAKARRRATAAGVVGLGTFAAGAGLLGTTTAQGLRPRTSSALRYTGIPLVSTGLGFMTGGFGLLGTAQGRCAAALHPGASERDGLGLPVTYLSLAGAGLVLGTAAMYIATSSRVPKRTTEVFVGLGGGGLVVGVLLGFLGAHMLGKRIAWRGAGGDGQAFTLGYSGRF